MAAAVHRPRLQVLAPDRPLPRWLGEALGRLQALGSVQIALQRIDTGPRPARLPAAARWWQGTLPGLAVWTPDAAQRASLQAWTSASGDPRPADACLSLMADTRHPPPGSSRRIPASTTPGACAAAPRSWALVDAAGGSLLDPFPLLERITAGEGLQLDCVEYDDTASLWRVRRGLHLPAASRYSRGIAGLAAAVARLLGLALADLTVEAMTRPTGAVAAPPPLPRVAWRASGTRSDKDRGGSSGHGRRTLRSAWRGFRSDVVERRRQRWSSEYWRIGVIDAPIAALATPRPLPPIRWITADDDAGYWADPFGIPGSPGELACEYFDQRQGVGRLERLRFDAADRLVTRDALSVGNGCHVSFPSCFDLDGRRYGLAETVATRECLLHAVGDDGRWTPLFPVLQDVAAADPVLFAAGGRYWLAYTDTDMGERDNLNLRHAERLEGPWTPHLRNPVKLDVRSARMAGQPFAVDGVLYRPAQDCLRTYGAAIVLHRILALTPTAYSEVEVRRLEPGGACPDGIHSLNAWGDRTLVDGKRHGLNPTAVGRKIREAIAAACAGRLGLPVPRPRPTPNPSRTGTSGRVLVYLPHLRLGGGETSVLRLAEGLAAAGLDVELVVHTLDGAQVAVPPGVKPVSLGCTSTAIAIGRLARTIRASRPDWVLSAFPHTNVAAIAARILSGYDARCVLTEHAPISQQIAQHGGWRYRLLPPLIRWAYRRADAVVAVSNGVRDDLQALARLRRMPGVIRNPVLPPDLASEISRVPDHPWLRDPSLDIVLSVARLSAEKDLPTLMRAFAEVHRQRPSTRLLIAGDGPERTRLEALRDECGLADVVRLPGHTRQPLRWMRHARVFVLPSRFEGFGNVLIEALACGTPVVSTDCPVGPREVLQGGAFGALVPVGDAGAMAREILLALDARSPPPGAREAALAHTQARACDAYLELLLSLRPDVALPC